MSPPSATTIVLSSMMLLRASISLKGCIRPSAPVPAEDIDSLSLSTRFAFCS